MGYELRRWFEDRLPQEISSGERVVALAIADLAWDDSRVGYGRKFMAKLLFKTGFENEAQLGKVVGKLSARGIELRVPINGPDGKPLRNKRGQFVYAHRGHQRTFRVPLASEFPGRSAPYWDDAEERSPDREANEWFKGERSPGRETFNAESPPAREGYRGERSPARESMVTQAGDPIPLTTTTHHPPPDASRDSKPAGTEGSKQQQNDALAVAVEFLMNLPAPWAVGRVTAKAYAPDLIEAIESQGWKFDEQLVTKLTDKPQGINRHSSVLRLRINDLPKRASPELAGPQSELPTWCGLCGDGNPAAEFNAKFRTEPGSKKPCHNCHPTHVTAAAA